MYYNLKPNNWLSRSFTRGLWPKCQKQPLFCTEAVLSVSPSSEQCPRGGVGDSHINMDGSSPCNF